MTYVQVPIERFGGLNLRASIETTPGQFCVDGLDFDLDDGGVVRERNSFQKIIGSIRPSAVSDHNLSGGRRYVFGCFDGSIHIWDYNVSTQVWTNFSSSMPTGSMVVSLVKYGTPNSSIVLALSANDRLRQVDVTTGVVTYTGSGILDPITGLGTIYAAPSGPQSFTGAAWGGENRMVYAGMQGPAYGPNALNGSVDHVWISEPGNSLLFRSDSFLVLGAGDGERTTCVRAWRDMVFVFKETKFFVLLNTSVSGRGVPTYNYRPIDTGIGCVGPRAAVVGRDGLYFVGQRGLYVTRGGDPELVSGEVEPLWTRESNSGFSQPFIDMSQLSGCCLAFSNERLFFHYRGMDQTAGITEHRIAVYDIAHNWWSLWQPCGGGPDPFVASVLLSGERRLLTGGGDTAAVGVQGTGVAMLRTTATGKDDGQTPPLGSYYETGFLDIAEDSLARVRQIEVWGSALQRLYAAADYSSTATIDVTITPYLSNDRGFVRTAFVGQRVSIGLSGFSDGSHQPWRVGRVVLHVSNKRVPSAV